MHVIFFDPSLRLYVVQEGNRKLALCSPDDDQHGELADCHRDALDTLEQQLVDMQPGYALLLDGQYVAERTPDGVLKWAQIVSLQGAAPPTLEVAAAALQCVYEHASIELKIKLKGKIGGWQ